MFDRDTLPPLNLSLLVKQLDWAEISDKWYQQDGEDIVLTPEEQQVIDDWGLWDQGTWARSQEDVDFCGSSYCQAGQAILQAGYVPNWVDNSYHLNMRHAQKCTAPDGTIRDIEDAAMEVLGLSTAEAGHYFSGDNDLGNLKDWVNVFAYRRGMALPYPELWTKDEVASAEMLDGVDE